MNISRLFGLFVLVFVVAAAFADDSDTYYLCTTKGRDVALKRLEGRGSIRTQVSAWSLFADDIWSKDEAVALKKALSRGFISLNDSKLPIVSVDQARMLVGQRKEAELQNADPARWQELQTRKTTQLLQIPRSVAMFAKQQPYSTGIGRMFENYQSVYMDLLADVGIPVNASDVTPEIVAQICLQKSPNGYLDKNEKWDGMPIKVEQRNMGLFLCGANKTQPKFVVVPLLQTIVQDQADFRLTDPKVDQAQLKCQHLFGTPTATFDKILLDDVELNKTLDSYAKAMVLVDYPDLRSRPSTPVAAEPSADGSFSGSSSGLGSASSSPRSSPRTLFLNHDLYDARIEPNASKPFRLSIGPVAKRGSQASLVDPTSFYACRYAESDTSRTPLDFSRENPVVQWWSVPELLRVSAALKRFGADISASELPLIGVADGVADETSMPTLVSLCKEKDVAYEWAEKVTAKNEFLFQCNGNRNHQVVMPTDNAIFASRKCQWLYGETAVEPMAFDGHQADVYAHRVAAKLAGQRPGERRASPGPTTFTQTIEQPVGVMSDLVAI